MAMSISLAGRFLLALEKFPNWRRHLGEEPNVGGRPISSIFSDAAGYGEVMPERVILLFRRISGNVAGDTYSAAADWLSRTCAELRSKH
jgi:hypothetical protein